MGAWGPGIMQDDIVLDVIEEFKDILKETNNIQETTSRLICNNNELIEDIDDGPLFWIAVAKCQWDYGTLDEQIYKKVMDNFLNENSLRLWKEESAKDYQKRKKVLADFNKKLEAPNLKIKKIPKLIVRKPIFEEGDCLSIKIDEDDHFGAAIVLRYDHSNPEYGKNLITSIEYWDTIPPSISIFDNPTFLKLTYGKWGGIYHDSWYTADGFRNFKDKIIKVGKIEILNSNMVDSRGYSSWSSLQQMIKKQYEYEKN